MQKLMIYTMTALFATIAVSIAAPDKDAMMAKEKAAWQAFKDKNAADFKKVVAADFLGVYAEGISDMKKELDDMQKWDMKSFAISDYNAVASERTRWSVPTRSPSRAPMVGRTPPAPTTPAPFGK
jgi:hypothetical protein